ncbi:hypothetical protein L2755_16015 [Shewanella abyssi]|uniref:hypothetical protein n=1 Tax=Shewanella abyssi TaxID=311789 RepID=UPI00200D6FCC|nr:hypothetical protein [Shewanella abyssi]MCL1051119.1 hypothetical protein [Shewanella abyssi]
MHKTLVLLMLFTANSFAFENNLSMLNGKWDCSPEANGELKLVNIVEYRTQDMSFIHHGKVTFVQKDGVESILESETIGTFKFESIMVEEQIDTIEIVIVKDETGFLTGAEESLRKAILAESAPLITKSLNEKNWVRINSTTNEITHCKKI